MIEITIDSQVRQMQDGHRFAPEKMAAARSAEMLFEQSYKAARWFRIRSLFRTNNDTLLHLHPTSLVQKKGRTRLQKVKLAQIKGSCGGRAQDFDACLRPQKKHNRARWVSVAMAFYMHKRLPPVDLVKVDDIYFVLDGHHRLSVAGSLGLEAVEAYVTECSMARPA